MNIRTMILGSSVALLALGSATMPGYARDGERTAAVLGGLAAGALAAQGGAEYAPGPAIVVRDHDRDRRRWEWMRRHDHDSYRHRHDHYRHDHHDYHRYDR